MDFVDFPIEFHSEVPSVNEQALREEAETRLLDLAEGHSDMIGAAIAIEAPGQSNDDRPTQFRARVVVYARPDDIVGSKQADTAEGALKSALTAVERQVRQKREKLGEPWKRTDLPGTPSSYPDLDTGEG